MIKVYLDIYCANYEGFRISLAIILKYIFRAGSFANNSGYKSIVASPYLTTF